MTLLDSFAVYFALVAYFAGFRIAIALMFDRRQRRVGLAPRLTILTVLGLLTLLSFEGRFWSSELFWIPLSAATVAFLHFVVTACRSPQAGDLWSELDRQPIHQIAARHTCEECTAPVPDAMDRCPCCARKVPWEARAGELLPIPTGSVRSGPQSLPVPSGAPGFVAGSAVSRDHGPSME